MYRIGNWFTGWSPLLDLLEQPVVAVRVAERGKRAVVATFRIRAGYASVVPGVVEHSDGVVEHLADLDAVVDELVAGRLDVEDDEVQALNRARHGRRDSVAEDDRGLRAGRRQLHDPEVLTGDEVGIQPPAQLLVEVLGPIDVGDGQNDDLELHVHQLGFVGLGRASRSSWMSLK